MSDVRTTCGVSVCTVHNANKVYEPKMISSTFTDDGSCRFTRFGFELGFESHTNPV